MRRARLEGTHIGRNPLILDHEAIYHDRCQGQSCGRSLKAIASLPPPCNVYYDEHPAAQESKLAVTKGV